MKFSRNKTKKIEKTAKGEKGDCPTGCCFQLPIQRRILFETHPCHAMSLPPRNHTCASAPWKQLSLPHTHTHTHNTQCKAAADVLSLFFYTHIQQPIWLVRIRRDTGACSTMTMREWVSAVLGIEPRGDTPQIIAKNRMIVFSPLRC